MRARSSGRWKTRELQVEGREGEGGEKEKKGRDGERVDFGGRHDGPPPIT